MPDEPSGVVAVVICTIGGAVIIVGVVILITLILA